MSGSNIWKKVPPVAFAAYDELGNGWCGRPDAHGAAAVIRAVCPYCPCLRSRLWDGLWRELNLGDEGAELGLCQLFVPDPMCPLNVRGIMF